MYVAANVSMSLLQNIFGSISCLGCSLVIITYFTFRDIRSLRYVELVFYVSLNDLIASLGVALGDWPNGSAGCWFQGLASNINYVSSIFWTTVISYQLWLVVHQGVTLQRADMEKIHLVCWLFPVVIALLPLSTNTYGNTDDAATWCFIANRHDSPSYGLLLWELLSFYVWVWLAIIVNVTLLFTTKVKLSEILVAGNADNEAAAAITTKINKLIFYPRILMLCWAASTVIDISDLFYVPDENSTGYVYGNRISTVLAVSQGWMLSIVFFTMNPVIRYKWRALFTNKVVYRNNRDNSFTFDIDESIRGTEGGPLQYSMYSVEDEPDFISQQDSIYSLYSVFSFATRGSAANTSNSNRQSRSSSRANESPTVELSSLDISPESLYPGLRTISSDSERSRNSVIRNPIQQAKENNNSVSGSAGSSFGRQYIV